MSKKDKKPQAKKENAQKTLVKTPKSVRRSSGKVQEIFAQATKKHLAQHGDEKKAKKAGKEALKKKGYQKTDGIWGKSAAEENAKKSDKSPEKGAAKKSDKKAEKLKGEKKSDQDTKNAKGAAQLTDQKPGKKSGRKGAEKAAEQQLEPKPSKKAKKAKKKKKKIQRENQGPLKAATNSLDIETLLGEDIPDENMYSSADVEVEPEVDLDEMEDLVDAEDPVEPLDELALAEFDREFAEEVADLEEVEHPGAPSGAEAPAQRRPIEVFTRQELYEEAKELDIPGRSRMTKQQLFDAIEEATA
ncbi:Rho termination factor N-terminal domain-containing protein [Rothia sp. P100]|uniref:Rho termination factor N-terminal domain-containing protein n=1 Tax=Rothia sp. P100 TaxID=2939578 RepID=UPI00203C1C4A|nr:Rho termination factor N-terminal domain-containing protein [Rothia sp. P100]